MIYNINLWLTKDQAKSLVDHIEKNIINDIKSDRVDNLYYVLNVLKVYEQLEKELIALEEVK